tara:strand:+ start:1020 stop:2057 length:1038 start_codon:yes stop_codon:yes gene_type:complete
MNKILPLIILIFAIQNVFVEKTYSQVNLEKNINGKIINMTSPGVLPEPTILQLMQVDTENESISKLEEQIVTSDGSFEFNIKNYSKDNIYRLVVDVGYYVNFYDVTNNNTNNIEISIYDRTDSLEDINLNSYIMMIPSIDRNSRQAGVLSMIKINNNGNNVFSANFSDPNLTGFNLFRFNLPDGWSNLSVESELPVGNVIEISTGFAMSNPIPPGEYSILTNYIINYENDNFDFDLKLPYGGDNIQFLLPYDAGKISAEKFSDVTEVSIGEKKYLMISGDDFKKNDVINVNFTGLPQPSFTGNVINFLSGKLFVIFLGGIFSVLLIFIILFTVIKRKNTNLEQYK